MPLSDIYNCDDQIGTHIFDPCPTNREYGRVRSAGFIKKTYLATLLAAPTTDTAWKAGIESGDIIVIPETAGSFDPGDPKELKGYGNRKSSNGPRAQQLVFNDPNYTDNYQFYNALTNITQFVVFFRTSSLVHIADEPAVIVAKDKVEDDLESEVTWEVTSKWDSINIPSIHDAANLASIFDGSYVAAPTSFDSNITPGASAVTASANGITFTVPTADADLKLEFNKITSPSGTPISMTLKIGTTTVATVDYPSDYANKPFRFTDSAGTQHTGIFRSSTGNTTLT
ncbi:hypothetical protein QTN47_17090 [Danxiaibacter flavus]|uniref:Uncharacterized protein n=1 Tax=Danxiaibacter flavus TaxID=3049108 RepID=A0ABV3ZHB7_9BACT|nr:hypothetical protein QNM32_17100 [Chitinophagaceae bacterium DXS]